MSDLVLGRNVQFIYEEQLARFEALALGCRAWERDEDDPRRVRVDVNGAAGDVHARAAYAGTLDRRPTVYDELIRPGYRGGVFNRTRSVNQYLTHWIYPYRGKFHPQMVRALLNIVGARAGSLVLDPFVGSGTTGLEASLLGAECVGVDVSPLCVLLARVKTRSLTALDGIRRRVAALEDAGAVDPLDPSVASDDDPVVADFVQAARMVALSDAARRRRDPAVWFRRNLAAMLVSVEAHARALDTFGIVPGRVCARLGDARALSAAGVADASVDAVVTSPPYSIALDYVKNDQHALEALGVSVPALRGGMTGVRGRGAADKLALYNADMEAMFSEVARVLKPGARAAFVIGDATVDRREYTTTARMVEWAAAAGLALEREVPKVVFGLYSVMRDEKILLFRRRGGSVVQASSRSAAADVCARGSASSGASQPPSQARPQCGHSS